MRSVAELAILLPLRATVKLVVAAAPVPSLIITLLPFCGLPGSVKVIPPAAATQYCPSTNVAGEVVCTSILVPPPVAALGKEIDCRAALMLTAAVPPLATGRVPVTLEVRLQ